MIQYSDLIHLKFANQQHKSTENATDDVEGWIDELQNAADLQFDCVTFKNKLEQWLHDVCTNGRKIMCVTSGGTRASLESNTVRFIDNFSTGSRGSISTEYFLQLGYGVIFFYRKHSFLPYLHRLNQCCSTSGDSLDDDLYRSQLSFLNRLTLANEDGRCIIKSSRASTILTRYSQVRQALLILSFETVEQYIVGLRLIGQTLNQMPHNVLQPTSVGFYLAAAVSDYYVPSARRPRHKIASCPTTDGTLNLTLYPVAKVIPQLTCRWIPQAFVISFKLETDQPQLIDKAKQSLCSNQSDVVVANNLQTRFTECWLVRRTNGELSTKHIQLVDDSHEELEALLVPRLANLHDDAIRSK